MDDLPARRRLPGGRACLPTAVLPEFDPLAESAGLPPVLVVLLRHVLILVILTRVGRDGLLGNFLHETPFQVLFVAL
jgi:hypothetical protein